MSTCTQAQPQVSCGNCGIIPASDWDGVAPDVLSKLAARKSIRTLAKGTYLFHQGGPCDALYRLLSGVVLLRKGDHDGNSLVVQMAQKRSLMGYRALIGNEPHAVSAHCVTDVVVCHIPVDVAQWAFTHNRALERHFTSHLAGELDQTEDLLLNILGLPVRERVLVLLQQLAVEFGKRDGAGMLITAPLLRMDMAAMLGIARESMSRCIHVLAAEGLVHFTREGIVVPSAERFEAAIVELRRARVDVL